MLHGQRLYVQCCRGHYWIMWWAVTTSKDYCQKARPLFVEWQDYCQNDSMIKKKINDNDNQTKSVIRLDDNNSICWILCFKNLSKNQSNRSNIRKRKKLIKRNSDHISNSIGWIKVVRWKLWLNNKNRWKVRLLLVRVFCCKELEPK